MTTAKFASLALCSALLLFGCGDPIGAPCDFTGSGFTASDNCRHRCLEHRTIECPDGSEIKGPKVCSGRTQCDPGECGDGQVCYHVSDPFEKDSYCIENTMCGALETSELTAWEAASKSRSDELIKAWEEKQTRRTNAPTKPAEPLQ